MCQNILEAPYLIVDTVLTSPPLPELSNIWYYIAEQQVPVHLPRIFLYNPTSQLTAGRGHSVAASACASLPQRVLTPNIRFLYRILYSSGGLLTT